MFLQWLRELSNLLFFVLHVTGVGSFPRALSAAEEKEALERMAQGDTTARNRLIEHNLRLVAHIIKKYYAASSGQEDLISIGTIGLIKAIDSFDLSKGIRLSSYASRCIENAILTKALFSNSAGEAIWQKKATAHGFGLYVLTSWTSLVRRGAVDLLDDPE